MTPPWAKVPIGNRDGLVFYLSDASVRRLFSTAQRLAPAGSALLFDCISSGFARGLAGEPGQHWGTDDPAAFLRPFGFAVEGSPSQGGDRFFVTARVDATKATVTK